MKGLTHKFLHLGKKIKAGCAALSMSQLYMYKYKQQHETQSSVLSFYLLITKRSSFMSSLRPQKKPVTGLF